MPKLIFLTSESPFPPSGGGKIRDLNLLKVLSERAEVEVLCFRGARAPDPPPEGLKLTALPRRKAPLWKRSIYPLRPYIVNGYSPEMERALSERAAPGRVLWISRLAMAQYLPAAKVLGYRVVLDEHNVESNLLYASALSSPRRYPALLHAFQCGYHESRFCGQADAVVATSDIDASRLGKLAPSLRSESKLHVVPNTIDADSFEPLRSQPGSTLFFSGTLSYGPNIEALHWFCEEILPRLRRARGNRLPRVVVAGADPSAETRQLLERAGIEVHANPPSILPFLSEAAVVMVPLKSGSGTRFKILEAMAAGKAVVSTGKGAEGLVLSPTYDIWIADAADRFTSAILHLIDDPQLRADMGARAAETIRRRYDWRSLRPLVASVLESVSVPAGGG
ncbi:MAG: glycosyltransferase family 4 protein [Oligoflexia bacterium]|nr:glycosyltransferase family 4 protein [Oligoflexia bacterium]